MKFLRPEATAQLVRWREVIVGVAVAGLGLYWALSAIGILQWVSVAIVLGGIAIIWEGIRRARFPQGTGGPGVLEITERQISYFAPGDAGGILSIDELFRIEVLTTGNGPFESDLFWIFHANDLPPLRIPGDAEGVDKIFDALAALPGVNYEQAIAAAGSTNNDKFLIWQKDRRRLH